MLIFEGVAWNELATAAVACISPAGVWATFWPGHRLRLRERRQKQLEQLLLLHVQLRHIRNWAGNQYEENAHNPDWYNASWFVTAFPWEYVEQFNRLVIAGDYSPALTAALIQLERSARVFHDLLADQAEYRTTAPGDIGLRWPFAVRAAQASRLSAEALGRVAGLMPEDRPWLEELYRRNREIHVVGIGRTGTGGLHDAWRAASERLDAARAGLQDEGDPWWRWVGHMLAGVFAIVGLLFLADFVWSSVAELCHPGSTAAALARAHRGTQMATPAHVPVDRARLAAPSPARLASPVTATRDSASSLHR